MKHVISGTKNKSTNLLIRIFNNYYNYIKIMVPPEIGLRDENTKVTRVPKNISIMVMNYRNMAYELQLDRNTEWNILISEK